MRRIWQSMPIRIPAKAGLIRKGIRMAPSFMARRLGEVVAGTGKTCPRPADVPTDSAVYVALVVDTDESGFVVCAIAVDYCDAAGGLLKRWPLAHYPAGAGDACLVDGRKLAALWGVPIRRATGTQG